MGCGASAQAANVHSPGDGLDNKEAQGSVKLKAAQLTKVNSQLGKKKIVNSFVVQKGRHRRRTDENNDTGPRKPVVARDTDLGTVAEDHTEAETILLPAESGAVADPKMKGPVSSSGPSFKMQRGLQAKLIAEMTAQGSDLEALPQHKDLLYSDKVADLVKGVSYIREKLSVVNPPVAAIRASGVLPRLVELLRKDDNRVLQYEVAWTLTNICSAEHDDCQDVVEQGAVPEFVRMLASCDDAVNVLEQAIWALGNVAADCADLQRYVLDEQVMQPLAACINRHSDNVSVLRHAMWLLANLSRPKPQSDELLEAMPTLVSVITVPGQDMEVATHACWALAYLTSLDDAQDELADGEGGKEALAQLAAWVAAPPSNLTAPALRVLGNMCSGSTRHTQAVLDAGGLKAFLQCLQATARTSLRKEIVWSLSNVAAGTCAQVEALLAAGVFPAVVDILTRSEETLKRECAYVLANPWGKTVQLSLEVAQKLVEAGLIRELTNLLSPTQLPSIMLLALEGLTDAVKKGQQMMREAYKNAPPPPELAEGEEAPPPPQNPVSASMKDAGAMEKLDELAGLEHEGVPQKANVLKSMLQFL